jgi:hypothetical protein
MRVLSDYKYTALSCGIVMLTGFGEVEAAPAIKAQILEDLRDCDGNPNTYQRTTQVRDYDTPGVPLKEVITNCFANKGAMVMISLNHKQIPLWEDILFAHDYKRVVDPVFNPNSNNKIAVYIRMRKES